MSLQENVDSLKGRGHIIILLFLLPTLLCGVRPAYPALAYPSQMPSDW